MKPKTFEEAREEAVEIFNLDLETKGLVTWVPFEVSDEICQIICHEKDMLKITKAIIKGENNIIGIAHPRTESLILIDSFVITFTKRGVELF